MVDVSSWDEWLEEHCDCVEKHVVEGWEQDNSHEVLAFGHTHRRG